MEDDREAARVRVTGRVQGVGFRAWTRAEAETLGLRGWVRNRPDGSVEAAFAGSREAAARMLAALERGPAAAAVERVERLPLEAEAEAAWPPGFELRR